jgi:maltokinase
VNDPVNDERLRPDLLRELSSFIRHARWFGGKGRTFTVVDLRSLEVSTGLPRVSIALVTLRYDDPSGGSETELYQVPLATYPEPQARLEHAFVADLEGALVYDAMHDREATNSWLVDFDTATTHPDGVLTLPNGLAFHRSGAHELDISTHSTVFRGEQSNTSVAFGDDALMKVFRRVTPGVNPDIEIHEALTRAGTHTIAELYGWLEVPSPEPGGPPIQLAMLQQFLRTASDGWELALTSARNLFAEADLHADEVGGDFAGEAHRLGVAVSEVHELLREQFPTEPFDATATAATMRRRLDEAVRVAPPLAEHAETLQRVFDRLGGADGEVQRIHGDLHLGQTLRTSLGWKLVDFEGEPAKSLAERQLPDSPWRDVAGMLRSFDYAAQSLVKDLHAAEEAAPQITYRANEWVERNRTAFLEGYVERRLERGEPALTTAEQAMIDAYEADKAVYEVVYEARNRPSWLDIPLHAIERIGADL